MKKKNLLHANAFAIAVLASIPMLAQAQAQPGIYMGTFTCGELQATPSTPGWTTKVQVEIQGSRLIWSRTGTDRTGGQSEYRETGSAQISSDGKAFIEAEGRYLDGSTKKGTWITRGEVTVENGFIAGQRLTQVDTARTRIFRNCTTSIPVQMSSGPSQAAVQRQDGKSGQGAATVRPTPSPSPAQEKPASKPVQLSPPGKADATLATAAGHSSVDLAGPFKAGTAYVCELKARSQNVAHLLLEAGGRYIYLVSSDRKTYETKEIGTWEAPPRLQSAASRAVALKSSAILDFRNARGPTWDVQTRLHNYTSAERSGSPHVVDLFQASPDVVATCTEGQSGLTKGVADDLQFLLDESRKVSQRATEARKTEAARFAHAKSSDDALKPLARAAEAVSRMERDPRCRAQAVGYSRQLDQEMTQVARMEDTARQVRSLNPWPMMTERATQLADRTEAGLKHCSNRQ